MLRQLLKLKHLDREERGFLKDEIAWEKNWRNRRRCPICGGELVSRSWDDESGCVETIEFCGRNPETTHYKDHWSYGYTDLFAGNNGFFYNFSDTAEHCEEKRRLWEAAIVKVKRDTKKLKRLAHRKKRTQRKRR
ncbi:hypothetical protein [Paenibacillus sp. MMO-58]|uniref:hypothetical protein n=1 Tax=Paenibacillus sp. MMO-58 TaxID=3081290 RepID=UPI0030189455